MMKEKNYSVIIVNSEATSSNREFNLSSKLIRNSIISVFILSIIFGFVIFDYLTTSFDKEKLKRLELVNEKHKKTIVQLTKNLDTTITRLEKMQVFKDRIMVVAGLQSPFALKEVGSGGSEFEGSIVNQPGDVEFQSGPKVIQPAKQPNQTVLENSSKVLKEAQKIEDSLKYVESHLNKQQAKFAATPSLMPTRGYISSAFARRTHPITRRRHFHAALDIATQPGNKIIAPADGYVLVTQFDHYLGNLIQIAHGHGYVTLYGHLSSFNVKEGERVKRGQVIGFVGNTGLSTASHLHYAIYYMGKPQNPINFIIE